MTAFVVGYCFPEMLVSLLIQPQWLIAQDGMENRWPTDAETLLERPDRHALPYEDRFNLAASLASVIDPKERQAKERIPAFQELLDHLGMKPEDRLRLLEIALHGRRDPLRFALAIQGESARELSLWGMLHFVAATGCYDARDRECLRILALALNVPWSRVLEAETALIRRFPALAESAPVPVPEMNEASNRRVWKIALASVLGGAALAASGRLAALLIEGAISTGLTTGFLGVTGATVVAQKVANRTREVQEFDFEPLGGEGMHVYLAISGWLTERGDFSRDWAGLQRLAGGHGACHALRWESQHLRNLGKDLLSLGSKVGSGRALSLWAERASMAAARALVWPMTLLMGADLIDNAWHTAADRAKKAGLMLADTLRGRQFGCRPVTLIGFSLGARLLFYALEDLARTGDFGIVHHAMLIGGAVTAAPERWENVHTVVAGKLINAYSTRDYVLGYLYRIAALEAQVAGLGPIGSSRVENVDVTDLSPGHLAYKKALQLILFRLWRILEEP